MSDTETEVKELRAHVIQLLEWQNELSVVKSLQAEVISLESRVTALEAAFLRPDRNTVVTLAQEETVPEFPTMESLVTAVENLFDCRDGQYSSTAVDQAPEGEDTWLYQYFTIGLITGGAAEQLPALRAALYKDFQKIRTAHAGTDIKPVLYWRYSASNRFLEDIDHRRAKINTRIAVPLYTRFCSWDDIPSHKPEGDPYAYLPAKGVT